jgi:threonine dehydratase
MSALLAEIEAAVALVAQAMAPTPQRIWPGLGPEVWLKQENHNPAGSIVLRGALVAVDRLRLTEPGLRGVAFAGRGNGGLAFTVAARLAGLPSLVVLPECAAPGRAEAIEALGGRVVVIGEDFQEAVEHLPYLAREQGFHPLPPFHPWLAQGAATAAFELFSAVPDLDSLFVPIGMGAAICGAVAARDALGLATRIIGVVAESAPAYADSFWATKVMTTPTARSLAEDLACRVPDPLAVGVLANGVERVVTVTDDEIEAAMVLLASDPHQPADAGGAAALAGLMNDASPGGRVGVMVTSGKVQL